MTAGRSNLVDIELDYVHQTDGALLVSDGKQEVWLPKSMIEFERKGGLVTVTAEESYLTEKGLL